MILDDLDLSIAFAALERVLKAGGHLRQLTITWADDDPKPSFMLALTDDDPAGDDTDAATVVAWTESQHLADGFTAFAEAVSTS